jgi:hypothetical protein
VHETKNHFKKFAILAVRAISSVRFSPFLIKTSYNWTKLAILFSTKQCKSKNNYTRFYLICLLHKTKIITNNYASQAARAIFVSSFFTIFNQKRIIFELNPQYFLLRARAFKKIL